MFSAARVFFRSRWFALLFVAVACAQCAAWLWFSGRQLATLRFDQTSGQIDTISAVPNGRTWSTDDAGNTTPAKDLKVRFDYTVAGQAYQGDRYRLAAWGLSGTRADQYVHDHPARSAVKVYYDPHDPARAVLVRGLEGVDLFFLLAAMVFGLAAAFLCAGAPGQRPLNALGFSLIVTAMASLLYLALIRGDIEPPIETMVWIWAANLGIGAAVYAIAQVRSRRATAENRAAENRAAEKV